MSISPLSRLLPKGLRNGITAAEKVLLVLCVEGKDAEFRSGTPKVDSPANSEHWGKDRIIRASLLQWLYTDEEATKYIHFKGVRVCGARVEGILDFEAARLSCPLVLFECAIPDGMIFRDADTRTLHFSGSHTGPIFADNVTVGGSVFLRQGFSAKGEVRFVGASINGSFECEGTIDNPSGPSLVGDGMTVRDGLFLRNHFRAKGEVRLSRANVGIDLDCNGAVIENQEGKALNAEGIIVKRLILLSKGFSANGEVSLIGAEIGGNLDCEGAKLSGTVYQNVCRALSADGVTVKGNVFLRNGFEATGQVRFPRANIGGDFDCHGSTFHYPNGTVLNGEGFVVGGALWLLKPGKQMVGALNLTNAKVGQLIDDVASWPENGKLYIDGFEYGAFGRSSPANASKRLRWIELQAPRPFQQKPYEQLAKIFREMGEEVEARKVLIAKHEAMLKHGQLSVTTKAWRWFLGKTIKYGYEPWRVVRFMLLMLLIGWGIFWYSGNHGCMHLAEKSGPQFNPFIYSLELFVPLVDLHHVKYWLPNDYAPYPGLLWTYFWLHIIFGWISSTLLVASFTGLIRKE